MLQHADRTPYHGCNSGSSKQYRLLGVAALCLRVRLSGRWAARSINLLCGKDAQDMEDLKTCINNSGSMKLFCRIGVFDYDIANVIALLDFSSWSVYLLAWHGEANNLNTLFTYLSNVLLEYSEHKVETKIK